MNAKAADTATHPPIVNTVSTATKGAMWLDRLDPPVKARPSLTALGADAPTEVDVAIVGGGYSGLWTAYYLAKNNPALSILVIEREFCGFGASGRNGGWCEGMIAGSVEKYAARSNMSEALRLKRAMFDTVDEVARVCIEEGIDCDYAKGGVIRVARNQPQADRQRAEVEHERSQGFTEEDVQLLDAESAHQMLGATNVLSGIFTPHCAAIDPAKLVRGLARTVEALGVTIVEDTEVTSLASGIVTVGSGRSEPDMVVRAHHIVRATEAYTRDLPGAKRDFIPVYSLMVATEPLDDSIFGQIGLESRPTFADDRYLVIYGQRTEDNRLAFGGRGVPYLFGSRINRDTEHVLGAHELIAATLCELFPVVSDVRITHRWGGVLAIPRNWLPGVTYDAAGGVGTLGGYVGEGVAAANLAGRTMADLVSGATTERTTLPWVGVQARKWEPEPLRWLGVRGSRRILVGADDRETKSDTEAKMAVRVAEYLRDGSFLAR